MLKVKTKGNLNKQEETILKQSLTSLRLAYVEAVNHPQAAPSPAPAEPPPAAPATDEQETPAPNPNCPVKSRHRALKHNRPKNSPRKYS